MWKMNRLNKLLKSEHALALLILTVCLAAFFRDIVFTGHTFFMMNRTAGTMPLPTGGPFDYPGPPGATRVADPGALAWVVEPYVFHSRECFRNFELPLWNPYSGMGNPHIGSGHAGVLDPLAIPVYLAPRSLYPLVSDLEVLCRFLIAGFCTYYFIRQAGLGFWAGVCGAAVFMHMNYGMDFGNHSSFKVFVLLPVLFCAYERQLRDLGPISVVLTALAIAWTVVADFAEATFLVLQLATLWYLFESAFLIVQSKTRTRTAANLLLSLVVAVVLGFALASPTLLPMLENVTQSDMSTHGEGSGIGISAWPESVRILSLLTHYKALGIAYAPHFYTVATLLALASPFAALRLSHGRRTLIFFGCYFVIGYAKVFGFPFTEWIGHLPVYKQVFLAKYLHPIIEFCEAMLVAVSIESFVLKRPSSRTLMAGAIILCGFTGYFIWQLSPQFFDSAISFGRVLTKFVIVMLLPCAVVVCYELFRLNRRAVVCGLFACILLEANLVHKGVERPLRCDPYAPPAFVSFLQQQQQASPVRICAQDGILYPNLSLAYKIDDVRMLTALEPARRKMFIQNLIDPKYADLRFSGTEEGIHYDKFLDLINMRFFLESEGDAPTHEPAKPVIPFDEKEGKPASGKPRFEKVYEKDGIRIFCNNNAMPRAFVVHSITPAISREDALAVLSRPGFDPRRQVTLEGILSDAAPEVLDHNEVQPEAAEITARTSNSLKVHARLERPGVLVVSETWYPGWTASVDGKPAVIHPADVMLRGVCLGAGSHEIEFVYSPLSFKVGITLAMIASVLMGGACVAVYIIRRKNTLESPANAV